MCSVDICRYRFTGLLVSLCGLLAQLMHTTVHIAVIAGVVLFQCIQYYLGFLGGSRIIEINQRYAIHAGLLQQRKIFSYALYVKSCYYCWFVLHGL